MNKLQGSPLQQHFSSITVIGSGKSGQAIALLGKQLGMSVFVSEISSISSETRSSFCRNGISWEEGHTEKILEQDLVVLSSGIPPSSPAVVMASKNGIPLMGELDFVTPHIKGDIIGITGSNGKSTTVALLAHLLQKCYGEDKVVSGGNIGTPLGEHALKDYSCVIAELSSFQLYWAQNPCLVGAGITNVVPDHLDWHGNYEDYIEAKKNILRLLKNDVPSVFIFREKDSSFFSQKDFPSRTEIFPFFWEDEEKGGGKEKKQALIAGAQKVFLRKEGRELFLFNPKKDLPLLGKHNVENAAFAASLASLWRKKEPFPELLQGLQTFMALPHRCENLGTQHGVTFINDSKGTNVAATITALESLEGRILILLGGKGKGEDYQELAQAVSQNARGAILFGAEARALEKALRGKSEIFSVHSTLEEAYLRALSLAEEGDTILLSPSCTSWDAYESYVKRGEHFRELVGKTCFNPETKRLGLLS
ncbi:MAG TPA: UDP-N-acetylmuramoyl-L-alanine--D-glutamate ligase [Synergistaceae bacterium]|nr:UDP-N-acetylmuramoyl-L-alanine--D-glutamate ligase [Synergistaceae bacterium]HPJ25497.1 UDP-N-acetylmuramoyl-L-alanine--D-glutamate ligase [Synergistaceae bacterium]HPQ36223.1 UDP-N-acetylmuramoyl-L-alanine--D-glutamate ligase [Synergistaceae bacterium]